MMHARRAPLRVTGYSVLSAVGASRDEHLAAFCEGRSGLASPTTPLSFETAVGEVKAPLPELPPALAARSTRMARMAAQLLQQIDEPLRRARARWRPERIGVLLGTSTAGMETTERAYRTFVREGVFPARYHFEKQHTFGRIKARQPRPSQSCGCKYLSYNSASAEPGSGDQLYCQRTRGGKDIRMDSVRPPDCRPKSVPRS
jgi:3-oxoacyl-[acyl-carrier-protein] synthase-1